MYDLSIILPTCNRAELLASALQSIQEGTRCDYEIIVVDGASEDHTPYVLTNARTWIGDRLKVIREDRREGFTRAANKGFRAATGRNLIWINDDARPLPGALDWAVEQIDLAQSNVGLLALFHRFRSTRNIAFQTTVNGRTYSLSHIRGTLYANFGLGKKSTYARLGYFDERFFLNGADPDLSLKAWHAGLSVIPAYGSLIDHDEHEDPRRTQDTPRAREDNEKLFAKWNLPPKIPPETTSALRIPALFLVFVNPNSARPHEH